LEHQVFNFGSDSLEVVLRASCNTRGGVYKGSVLVATIPESITCPDSVVILRLPVTGGATPSDRWVVPFTMDTGRYTVRGSIVADPPADAAAVIRLR
jgi:hypothetical protein